MREIKFRAWHKFSQQMYNVGYLHFAPNGELYGLLANETMQWGNLLAVKDFDLMQFTGLLDKNGKEVYEGDIIKSDMEKSFLMHNDRNPQVFSVEYDERMLLQPLHAQVGYDGEIFMDVLVDGFEVIGNIYEHKHLLPEGTEA